MSSQHEEIQHVLINEIDVDKKHGNTVQQLIRELVAAPVVGQSRNSSHIAKCIGPYVNSKVSKSLNQLNSNLCTAIMIIGHQNLAGH